MQSADSVGPLRCYGLGLVDPEASTAILIVATAPNCQHRRSRF